VQDEEANWVEGSFENTLVLIDDYEDKVLKELFCLAK